MDFNLRDRVVYVGGASRGIGLGIARAFLDEGARVIITGRDKAVLDAAVESLGVAEGRVLALSGDLSAPAFAAESLASAARKMGPIDVVVPNVGGGTDAIGWDVPDHEWRRVFDQNFWASQRLAQAAVPHLEGRGGALVITGSIAGYEALGAPVAYEAAKAALIAYAKELARKVATLRIRVNVVVPGNVVFPGGRWARRQEQDPKSVTEMLARDVPLGRFGTPEDIASAVVFLASSRASFITGACLVVDGGQTRTI